MTFHLKAANLNLISMIPTSPAKMKMTEKVANIFVIHIWVNTTQITDSYAIMNLLVVAAEATHPHHHLLTNPT